MSGTTRVQHYRKVLGHGRVEIGGSFLPQSTSAPVLNQGVGWSVARTSAGLHTVTFEDKFLAMESCRAFVRAADALPTYATGGDFSLANRTLQIRTWQAPTVSTSTTLGLGRINLPLAEARILATNAFQNAAANGGLSASDSAPILERVNGATDIAARLRWIANGVEELQWSGIPYPADLDDTAAMTVELWLEKGSNTDTSAVVGVKFAEGKGDTVVSGNTAALSSATLAKKTVTVAASDVLLSGGFFNIGVVPGAHANDAIHLYSAAVTYSKVNGGPGAAFALTDLAADADNEISFVAVFKTKTAK